MSRTLGMILGLCISYTVALNPQARADAIQLAFTGNANLGTMSFTEDLSSASLETGFTAGLGSRTVGPFAAGSINTPVSVTLGLSDLSAPGSPVLTISVSGGLTGKFVPYTDNYGDPTVEGSGTINSITISANNPATNQLLSATIQGPNGTLNPATLAQFAAISGIPQSLLSTLTTPSQFVVSPDMGGGTEGVYGVYFGIRATPTLVPAPEPAPIAIFACTIVAYLFKRKPRTQPVVR